MKCILSVLALTMLLCSTVLVSACAGHFAANHLQPGVTTLAGVTATMGTPAVTWKEADGSEQLAYPRGPADTQTYMVFIGADGRLQRIDAVLDLAHFARIENDKSDKAAVLRLLGPSQAQWTAYFKARDELVWEWSFCDEGSKLARFDVLFDATTGIVRTTYQRPDLKGADGIAPFCGH